MPQGGADQSYDIPLSFDGSFSLSTQHRCTNPYPSLGTGFGISLYNSSGDLVFSDTQMAQLPTSGGSYSQWYRVEFVETSSGQGIECYLDGVLVDSSPYSVSNPGTISTIRLHTRAWNGQGDIIIDDITTSENLAMVTCDNEILSTDTYQYFRVGYPIITGSYWFARCYAPDGTIISVQNTSTFSEYSIPKTLINQSGTYTIRLFQHTSLGNDFFYASKSFIYSVQSGYSLTLDKDQYTPGNQITIFSYMPSYLSGYRVALNYNTGAGLTPYIYDITTSEMTKRFTLPSNTKGGSYFAYLLDPSGDVVAYDSFYVSAPAGAVSLTLDKSTYENNDTIKITYQNMPEDTRIDLYLKSGSTNVFTTNFGLSEPLSGSGVKTVDIGGRAADSVYVKATKGDIFEGTILAETNAVILSGEYLLSGKIYDSSSNVPISGATIYVGGSSTTTNALGYYEMTVLAGTQPVSIVCDGYNQYTGNVQVYSLSTSRNFYLVKTITTGSNTLYGTITDYYTGAPLNSTYIQIKNGSTVYSMLTHSKTGNYLFDQEGLTGEWDVTVTKTGYDTHTRTVTIDGDTYLSIKLVPVGGSSSVPDDDSDSGSSGSSSSDRPSREAAKDSLTWLEGTIPDLVKLAVLVFMLALLGWRF
jgi:hypothetical protein